jgi:APA family basic amino acid/polyamine antiporter
MAWNQLFAKKSLDTLLAEAAGENRLRRILGPISLTSLGIGAIIGTGIFVMTGRVAAVDAGPAIVLSFVVAGIGCVFAALCYSEFASMAPVAGSAYTYAYATLGEVFAWIIGWDLILEYAMACAVVAAGWTKYFNKLLELLFDFSLPEVITSAPFSEHGAWTGTVCNLPAVIIILIVTVILVIGIRESATTNAFMVAIKVGVVIFVIALGIAFVQSSRWTDIPLYERLLPGEDLIKDEAEKEVDKIAKARPFPDDEARKEETHRIMRQAQAEYKIWWFRDNQPDPEILAKVTQDYQQYLAQTPEDKARVQRILKEVRKQAPAKATEKWGLIGTFGLNKKLSAIDDSTRSPFAPYGLSGIIFGASIVFFAYIGFDAISTHAEEAKRPQRDVPIGILASLVICTILYILMAAVLTGMVPYPEIDRDAAVADAFNRLAKTEQSVVLRVAATLIAVGALAGLTSVLLITFLSQARIFLAMARDGLLPPSIFGVIHPRFRTPHLSTMLTGGVIAVVAAFTPIAALEEMVNIGTLMAFVIVCAAVWILRVKQPNAQRPFRTPAIYLVAPLGILFNLMLMLFLAPATWGRLVIWLIVGMVIYLGYSLRHSILGRELALGLPPGTIALGGSGAGTPHNPNPGPPPAP